ncbi:MFS transporter [Edaphobacter aggregans]|uniref:MFS transporter n=1 Tax=Edaphobacter aggregans TaxID=570835 RepID=UPI0007E8C683|nr:MFS transporter [Edaphobacter aggregans]
MSKIPQLSETSRPGHLDWWRQATPEARRALAAASFGWMLDSFDVMLYALVLASLILDLGISKQTAGVLGSITLLAAAAGGLVFGVIADRYGRVRALIGSVLIYALFTAACGFAQNIVQLALFRILLGLGMGGEWASGAALVAETWPDKHRGKALGIMQSSWAVGYALAALVAGLILPWKGWRVVFFVGILPAFFTLVVRGRVAEPEIWKRGTTLPREGPMHGFRRIFQSDLRPITIAITFMNSCTLFAWWGFNLWVPAYLSLPRDRGGIGLSAHAMSGTVIAMQAGMWFGYVSFGFLSDVFGRKRCYVLYLILAGILMFFYARVHTSWLLIALGPLVAFFGTGYYTGFAAVTAEIYQTRVRATAQGFAYNVGRIASAAAPFAVGNMAQQHGFGDAFAITGTAFVIAAFCWLWIPETKGRPLT